STASICVPPSTAAWRPTTRRRSKRSGARRSRVRSSGNRVRGTPAPAAGPARESGSRVAAVVFAMMTVQAVATMGVLALAGIAPELGRSLGLDPVLIGYQIAVVYAGAMAT